VLVVVVVLGLAARKAIEDGNGETRDFSCSCSWSSSYSVWWRGMQSRTRTTTTTRKVRRGDFPDRARGRRRTRSGGWKAIEGRERRRRRERLWEIRKWQETLKPTAPDLTTGFPLVQRCSRGWCSPWLEQPARRPNLELRRRSFFPC
jgi:hypothetical protein